MATLTLHHPTRAQTLRIDTRARGVDTFLLQFQTPDLLHGHLLARNGLSPTRQKRHALRFPSRAAARATSRHLFRIFGLVLKPVPRTTPTTKG